MAIKGKSKPKARRAVTPGPRPAYVHVKRPLLARRGFQVGVLGVVVVAALVALTYGIVRERNQNHQRALAASMRSVMTEFSGQVQGALSGVGQASGPSFSVSPQLTGDIKAFQNGGVDAAKAASDASSLGGALRTAVAALDKIDPAGMLQDKGFDQPFVINVIDARFKMENGLKMYAQAADLLGAAAKASGAQVDALLKAAQNAADVGKTVFDDGWIDYTNAQYTAGTYQPSFPSGAVGT